MSPHPLNRTIHSNSTSSDQDNRVEKIEVWQLTVYAFIYNMQLVVSMARWSCRIIETKGSLKRAAFDTKAFYRLGRMSIVIGINPSLWSRNTVLGYNEDDVLGPYGPSYTMLAAYIVRHECKSLVLLK